MRPLIIEREADIYPLPRAVHFDDEVMRVFQTIGISGQLKEHTLVNPGMKFLDADGGLIADWPRPVQITANGWNASYRFHQPDLERLLRKRMLERSGGHVMLNHELSSVEQNDGIALLSVVDRATGKQKNLSAKFVIGCDGANSLVRDMIGGGMTDLGFQERWLVIDVLLKRERPDLGDFTVQHCDPNRPMTYCRNPGGRRRWEIALRNDEIESDVTNHGHIWSLLEKWITPEDGEIERSAVYTFRSKVANRWRLGSALIAGDAAHMTPPFLGQGMCMGIRDATNLAWKLAEVILNNVDDALLDTYQAEQAPQALLYVETAIKLGRLIHSLDREGALTLTNQMHTGAATLRSIAPKLGKSQVMIVKSASAEDLTGRPAAQLVIGQKAVPSDDIVGFKHLLLSKHSLKVDENKCVVFVSDKYPEINSVLTASGSDLVWIRPDRYVGAVVSTIDELPGSIRSLLITENGEEETQ